MQKQTKKRVLLITLFICVVAVLGVVYFGFLKPGTSAGEKEFTIIIESERDSFSKEIEVSSDAEYVGEFLREQDFVSYEESDYGIYIHGFYDMYDDMENQYWWCILVNGESSTLGADSLPIEEGMECSFVLKQGW